MLKLRLTCIFFSAHLEVFTTVTSLEAFDLNRRFPLARRQTHPRHNSCPAPTLSILYYHLPYSKQLVYCISMGKNDNNKKKANADRDLTAEEVVHWLKAQDNMPHPLRTNPRVMLMWMKAMNTGLPEHILTTLRPAVMDLWQQYGSGFAWTRVQVEATLAVAGPDLRPPVLTTPWQRQGPLPALAVTFPRSDWSRASRRAIDEDVAAGAAATEQQLSSNLVPRPHNLHLLPARLVLLMLQRRSRQRRMTRKDQRRMEVSLRMQMPPVLSETCRARPSSSLLSSGLGALPS